MNSTELVLRYAPDLYTENRDMLAVYNAQKKELVIQGENSYQAFLNNFVKTSDLEGIRRWEKILKILADELNETLDYRKARVLNKLVQQPPYTRIFLEQMLNALFGEDMYSLRIVKNEYKIKIGIETEIEGLFQDTIENIKKIIPANMILEVVKIEKYMHLYLRRNYKYGELEQFTYGELSQYAGGINNG